MTRMRGVFVSAVAIAAVTTGYFVFRQSGRELPVQPADPPSRSAVSRVTTIAPVMHAPATGTADGSRSRCEGYRFTLTDKQSPRVYSRSIALGVHGRQSRAARRDPLPALLTE
jgi:hypothetical protein